MDFALDWRLIKISALLLVHLFILVPSGAMSPHSIDIGTFYKGGAMQLTATFSCKTVKKSHSQEWALHPIERRRAIVIGILLRARILVVGFFFMAYCNTAWSSQLNPCFRVLTYNDGNFGQEKIRFINMCNYINKLRNASTVHEHMTVAAILEHKNEPAFAAFGQRWKFQYMVNNPWPDHLTYAIVFGTWWNDDPLMRSWGQGLDDFVWGGFSIWRSMEKKLPEYAGGISGCKVAADEHLGRLSHFGRLQHLHFMTTETRMTSSAEKRVQSTVDAALNWIEFAYSVATRNTAAESALTSEQETHLGLPQIAKNYCVKDPRNVKIRTLFSRLGHDDTIRNKMTPDVALGTILHVLQDSFSPSHTCRVKGQIGDSENAILVDVENYKEQLEEGKKDTHTLLDGYPAWMRIYAEKGYHMYTNDPVAVGAWIISAVGNNLPWEEVKTHLNQTIFFHNDAQSNDASLQCIGRTVEPYKEQ